MQFSPSASSGTIVFYTNFNIFGPRGNPLAMASNEAGVGKMTKNADFLPMNPYISETIEGSYNGRLIGNRIRAFGWY